MKKPNDYEVQKQFARNILSAYDIKPQRIRDILEDLEGVKWQDRDYPTQDNTRFLLEDLLKIFDTHKEVTS